MKRYRATGALASVGAVAASLAIAASATAATPARTQLRNSKSPAAATTPQTGAVSAGTAINFEVDLQLADPAGAQALAQAVSTPGSPSYQQYLTPAQWESRFSPTAASVNEVKAFLTQSGFTVDGVSSDRMSVQASGTAQQVEQAFGTTLGYHDVHGDSLLLANQDLSIPSDIAGVVGGVTGVSDTQATPDNTTGGSGQPAASSNAKQPAGYRSPQPCGAYYGQIFDTTLPQYPGYGANPPWDVCGYTGPQLRSAYGLTGADDGTGETVAIVDAYESPTLFSDAHKFSAVNDPGNALRQSQFSEIQAKSFNKGGPKQCGASGWYGEQTLDVEAVHDTAPGANILYAGAKNCAGGLNRILRRIVDNHLAEVVTNSYGDDGGDVLDSADDRAATDNILLMAADTGVSVMYSSGDSGDEFTTIGQVAADYPASSPYATAVGGTSLEVGASGQRTGEYGWSTANSYFCNAAYQAAGGCTKKQLGQWLPINLALDGGSGGGTSQTYIQPYYQAGVVPAALAERNGSTPMRVEPDISMDADPSTGMLEGETQTFPNGTYYDQYRIGGTSVASPLFAGVVARADETAGQSLGFLNPALYSLYGTGANKLYDILPTHQDMSRADYVNSIDSSQGFEYQTRIVDYEGAEQYCDPKTKACTTRNVALNTAPGYDSMTGLGSPGANFVQALSRK